MSLLTDEHRKRIGTKAPAVTVEISRRDIQKYAAATEQRLDKYVRGDEAPLMFVFNLFNEIPALSDLRSDGLPRTVDFGAGLPVSRIMAGGIEIRQHRAMRPGDVLVGSRTVIGLYEKQGRSGPLVFVVTELAIADADGEPVATALQTHIGR